MPYLWSIHAPLRGPLAIDRQATPFTAASPRQLNLTPVALRDYIPDKETTESMSRINVDTVVSALVHR